MNKMPDIKDYQFGKLCIEDRSFNSDLIIYPSGKIDSKWWRKSGHVLETSDILQLISEQPEIIIVGTGASGLMKIDQGLMVHLDEMKIKIMAYPTYEAVNLYVNKIKTEYKIGACFHLTC